MVWWRKIAFMRTVNKMFDGCIGLSIVLHISLHFHHHQRQSFTYLWLTDWRLLSLMLFCRSKFSSHFFFSTDRRSSKKSKKYPIFSSSSNSLKTDEIVFVQFRKFDFYRLSKRWSEWSLTRACIGQQWRYLLLSLPQSRGSSVRGHFYGASQNDCISRRNANNFFWWWESFSFLLRQPFP